MIAILRASLAAFALIGLIGLAPPARAASLWSEGTGAKLRLLAGAPEGAGADRVHWAGIEIALDRGWKTYWRSPGDSGIPARIDAAASRNLKAIELLWPAPERFVDEGGTTFGYKGRVVLPLRITPVDAAAPVILSLAIDYGVCETLCVPVHARAQLLLFGAGPDAAAVAQARARLPAIRGGLVRQGEFGVHAVSLDGSALLVQATAAEGRAELFLEGPPELGLPAPERIASGGNRAVYRLPLDDRLRGRLAGQELVSTMVAGARAVEQRWRVPEVALK